MPPHDRQLSEAPPAPRRRSKRHISHKATTAAILVPFTPPDSTAAAASLCLHRYTVMKTHYSLLSHTHTHTFSSQKSKWLAINLDVMYYSWTAFTATFISFARNPNVSKVSKGL